MSVSAGFEAEVIRILKNDAGVAALVSGRVTHEAEAQTVFAHIAIGAWRVKAWNTVSERGEEIVFALVASARKGGRMLALDVLGAAALALEGGAYAVPGGHVVGVFFDEAEAVLDKDRQSWRARGRFRALIDIP